MSGVEADWSETLTGQEWVTNSDPNKRIVRYLYNGVTLVAAQVHDFNAVFPLVPCLTPPTMHVRSDGFEFLQKPSSTDRELRSVFHDGTKELYTGVPLNALKVGGQVHVYNKVCIL